MNSNSFRPEVLAPVGSPDALYVALAAGADAVYAGLSEGFNARAKTAGISRAELKNAVRTVHLHGARIYITLNTLIYENELSLMAQAIDDCAQAGVDALIVQDFATAELARHICPELALHGSTQMTLTSPDAVRIAEDLGFTRVIAPRELSAAELKSYVAATNLEVEAFVHGALCISWSGQCDASENLTGAKYQGSANRGTCFQPCRMPYRVFVDRKLKSTNGEYLFSPGDQNLSNHYAPLRDSGVASLKIEGRQKSLAYLAAAVQLWRNTVDGTVTNEHRRAAALAFSRSENHLDSSGFFANPKRATFIAQSAPGHRGVALGEVASVRGHVVFANAPRSESVEPGQGVVFAAAHPWEETGGPIFAAKRDGQKLVLDLGHTAPDLTKLTAGQKIYITSDPEVQKLPRKLLKAPLPRRLSVNISVSGTLGTPLEVSFSAQDVEIKAKSEQLLESSANGLTAELLKDKLAALGQTPFVLQNFEASLPENLYLSPAALKLLRREAVAALENALAQRFEHQTKSVEISEIIKEFKTESSATSKPALVALCRTLDQVKAARVLDNVELDLARRTDYEKALDLLSDRPRHILVATPRISLENEPALGFFRDTDSVQGILIRNLGALHAAQPFRQKFELHGDNMLNARNPLSAAWFLSQGLQTLADTNACDVQQQSATAYKHPILFHSRHCFFAEHCANSGPCREACRHHRLEFSSEIAPLPGGSMLAMSDAQCCNTLFAKAAQTRDVLELVRQGVRRIRFEFTDESENDARRILTDALQKLENA